MTVGAADEAYERRTAGMLASDIGAPSKSGATATVQRYQAGETGHGGIEEEALLAAGFGGTMTTGDIGKVYLGNWMRDFSQIGDPHDPRILTILNILSLGEFDRPVTAEQVGGYLPSEHLDNPAGGESVENPDPGFKAQPATVSALSASQKDWVAEEKTQAFKNSIGNTARQTHLPEYIEVGKEHARRELMIALSKPRGDPDGMMALGNALHTIEDYFAHSNFTDACIYMLVADGAVPETSSVFQRLKARALRFGYDPSGGIAGAQANTRPEIMTGTYGSAGNKQVSLLEQLSTEVQTGSLRNAAVLGARRLAARNPGALGALEGYVAGTVLGGVAGAVRGAVEGAAEQGWTGLKEGTKQGWQAGFQRGGEEGAMVGALIGSTPWGRKLEVSIITGMVSLINAIIAEAKSSQTASALASAVAEAQVQTQTDVAAGLKSGGAPSHSQLAKDDPEHPVYGASRHLAVYVDTQIGTAMMHAWDAGGSPESVAQVTGLVDRFVCNPADSDWWREPLLQALKTA